LLHGWLPYRFAPFSINAFWTALTLLDLAVAFFLLWHPPLGMLLALLIMTSDVTAVFYATRLLGSGSGFLALQRELQWLFLAVLLPSASDADLGHWTCRNDSNVPRIYSE
jgi:hypothetical protein